MKGSYQQGAVLRNDRSSSNSSSSTTTAFSITHSGSGNIYNILFVVLLMWTKTQAPIRRQHRIRSHDLLPSFHRRLGLADLQE